MADADVPNSEEYEVPQSRDHKVPLWLKITYITLPIWGIITLYLFFNGSWGWFDRGYWHELQEAANTTYPYTKSPLAQ